MASRYSTIAIKPKVHEDIKKLAKHSFQTVGGYIEKLIEKEMKQMKWEKEHGNNMSQLQG
jgi:mRNA-degrading endonuclease RelE of RelBE toxin-antitoxin system|tara:strand:+ start:724 stop:903 length:180 start_codon:yes stop_codon:yes gene_type:complete